MGITLKKAKELVQYDPNVLFFVSLRTSCSSGWSTSKPITIDDIEKRAKEAEGGDYVLFISPCFPRLARMMKK